MGLIPCNAGRCSPWSDLAGCIASLPSPGRQCTNSTRLSPGISKQVLVQGAHGEATPPINAVAGAYLAVSGGAAMHIRTNLTGSTMQPAAASFDASSCSLAPTPASAPRCSAQRKGKAGEQPGLVEESCRTRCPLRNSAEGRRTATAATNPIGELDWEEQGQGRDIGGGRRWWLMVAAPAQT